MAKKKKAAQRRPRPPRRPPSRASSSLHLLSPAERKQIHDWGRAPHVQGNPPAWVVDKAMWERAKQAVLPHWETYREPWAVVAHVYHAMRRGRWH